MIQRLVFELNAVGTKTGLESERKANEYHNKIIEPAVEACFRDIEPADNYLIIDSLDIDLGVFTPDNFKSEARERLIKRLGGHLKKISRKYADTDNREGVKGTRHRIDAGMRRTSDDNEHDGMHDISAGRSGSNYEALIAFLEQGRFPWWFDVDHFLNKIENEPEQEWVQGPVSPEAVYLRRRLLQSAAVRTRLASGFRTGWAATLLQQIGLNGDEALMLWNIMLPALHSTTRSLPLFRHYFWTSWIVAAGKEEGPDIQYILEATVRGESQLFRELLSELRMVSRKEIERTDLPERVRQTLKSLESVQSAGRGQKRDEMREPEKIKDPSPRIRTKSDEREETGQPSEITLEHEERDQAGNTDSIEKVTAKGSATEKDTAEPLRDYADLDEGEPLFLQAAGLVLLHPFLPELFEKTGLRNGKNWLFDDAPFHAVNLLGYLSYNEVDLPEYRLLLHKILSGLKPDTLLPPVPPLSPEEKASSDELLEAVILHWKALRSTSPDGLREMYLKRDGKLVIGESGYNLHIEKRTEDILLSRLPWGYSIVKLPWMDKIINVSWA